MISDDLLLLKIIDSNGSVSLLLDRGLSYSQVANIIQLQIELNNVVVDGYELKLTQQGRELLEKYYKVTNANIEDRWIVPQDYHYHKPINKYTVILPKKL